MRRDYLIPLLLWIAALAVAVALMAEPLLFPDQPRAVLWTCFLGGVGIGAVGLLGALILSVEKNRRRRPKLPLGQMALLGLGIIALATWLLWPIDPFDRKMDGVSVLAVVRIYDVPEARRKFLFSFTNKDGAQFSFYISASDIFTLSATDVQGESYPLEARLGKGGVPIDDFIVLICEVGVASEETLLRVLVNGHEVKRRSLPVGIKLGGTDWAKAHLGTDPRNENPGAFLFMEMGLWPGAFTNETVKKLVDNARLNIKLPFP